MSKNSLLVLLFTISTCMLRAQVTIGSTRVCYGVNSTINNTSAIPATNLVEWDLDNDGFFDDASGNTVNYAFAFADTFRVRLKITDSLGQEYFSATPHLVIVDPLPSVAFSADGACLGQPTLFTNYSLISDGTSLTFEWDFTNDNTVDNTSENANFQYTAVGTYNVRLWAHSTQNCTASLLKTVAISQRPVADFALQSTCVNSPALFVNQSQFPGSPIKRSVWSFGDDFLVFNQDSIYHTYGSGDTFFVQLKITDTSGCVDSITKPLVLESGVDYTINLSNGNSFYQGQSTTATVTGAFASIVWNDTVTLASRVINAAGSYSFTVTNSAGCVASDAFTITTVAPPTAIGAANDFITPNNDGKNDVLTFRNLEAFTGCKLKIYDQRGLQVYTNDGYANDWNGESNIAGAYYYFLKCNEVEEVKGLTNLIR